MLIYEKFYFGDRVPLTKVLNKVVDKNCQTQIVNERYEQKFD